MKPIHLQFLLTVFLLSLLAACAPRSGELAQLPEATPVSAGPAGAGGNDYEQLIAALRAGGLPVETDGTVEDPFFSGEAFSVTVAGAPVSVYQFPDEAAAAAAAATVNPTGTIIGTAIVDWAEPPHFYRQGRLLALYAGENETVLDALAAALGQPFVAGDGLFGPLPDGAAEPAPSEPVALGLRSLQVEVGVGSPLPVHVTFDAEWPSLCAQLARVTQEVSPFRFDITVFAHPGPADCPADHVGLSYRLSLPVNIVELPEGSYIVTVNGLETTFDLPVGGLTGESAPPQESANTALCPEVPRPALALFVPGEGYVIANPIADSSCQTALAGDTPGLFQVAGDGIYYAVRGDASGEAEPAGRDNFAVKQVGQDGSATTLPFTTVPFEQARLGYQLHVSGDQRLIAWSAGYVPDGDLERAVSQLWLADMDTGDVWTPLPEARLQRADAADPYRMLVPVRFSADGNTLFYAVQPVITDSSWDTYSGRYDNLYALRLRSEGPPELLFDCAEEGMVLCLGDFYEAEGQVMALAYVDAKNALVIKNGAGDTLNTISVADDYVGRALFGPEGDLVFYGADKGVSLEPEDGTLYRVAPLTAPYEALASNDGLRFPQAWFDTTHVVVDYVASTESWGAALIGLDGTVVEVFAPDAPGGFVAVLPAGQ